jgi:hypothetical protein
VFARQGHYAFDPANIAAYPAAAWSVDRIRDLTNDEFTAFLGTRHAECAEKEPR